MNIHDQLQQRRANTLEFCETRTNSPWIALHLTKIDKFLQ